MYRRDLRPGDSYRIASLSRRVDEDGGDEVYLDGWCKWARLDGDHEVYDVVRAVGKAATMVADFAQHQRDADAGETLPWEVFPPDLASRAWSAAVTAKLAERAQAKKAEVCCEPNWATDEDVI
jgi:hypothetical protein